MRAIAWLLAGLLLAGHARADAFSITSPAFGDRKPIPARYSMKGDNIPPELHLANAPVNARSFVLIVEDPDAPAGLWTHWLLWNFSETTITGRPPKGATQGTNSFGHTCYDGPAPPSGTHRYQFKIMALDSPLKAPPGASRETVETAMQGHVVDEAQIVGTFSANP
jgi:Raf kinase inhibitor-like YbhB/YbcL family protein